MLHNAELKTIIQKGQMKLHVAEFIDALGQCYEHKYNRTQAFAINNVCGHCTEDYLARLYKLITDSFSTKFNAWPGPADVRRIALEDSMTPSAYTPQPEPQPEPIPNVVADIVDENGFMKINGGEYLCWLSKNIGKEYTFNGVTKRISQFAEHDLFDIARIYIADGGKLR